MTSNTERIPVGDVVSIYRRGAGGIFTAEYQWNGQHQRQSLRTKNKKIAIQRAVKLEASLLAGTHQQAPPRSTIRQAITCYIEHLTTEGRRPKTTVKYAGVLNNFAEFGEARGFNCLAQVTPARFDEYRADRRQNHSPKSMFNDGVIIKQFIRWCRTRRLIADNPLEECKLRKPPMVPKDRPSLAQVDQVLAAGPEPLRTYLATLAFTGMRSGQLQRLRPRDVDLDGNWITIQPVPGAKTHVPVTVPIHPRLRPILEAVSKRSRPWFFTAGPSNRYPDGQQWINPKKLNDEFEKLAKKLGQPVGASTAVSLCIRSEVFSRPFVSIRGYRSAPSTPGWDIAPISPWRRCTTSFRTLIRNSS